MPSSSSVGVALHQELVDVGAGIALVAVDDDHLLGVLGRGSRTPTCAPPGSRRRRGRARWPSSTSSSSSSGRSSRARGAGPTSRPAQQHRLVEHAARTAGSGASRRRPAATRSTTPAPGVDQVAVADRGRPCGRSRGRRSRRARRSPSSLRSPRLRPSAALDLADVLAEVGRPAGGAGADPDVAAPARLQQVVVEGRDAVDGRLGQARGRAPRRGVVVGDLAALTHRGAEQLDDRGRAGRADARRRAERDWRTCGSESADFDTRARQPAGPPRPRPAPGIGAIVRRAGARCARAPRRPRRR